MTRIPPLRRTLQAAAEELARRGPVHAAVAINLDERGRRTTVVSRQRVSPKGGSTATARVDSTSRRNNERST
jgi:hypothetical protein